MKQYTICYENKDTLEELKKHGEITYSSRVLNLIFFGTHESPKELYQIKGVLNVKQNYCYRYSHKR